MGIACSCNPETTYSCLYVTATEINERITYEKIPMY